MSLSDHHKSTEVRPLSGASQLITMFFSNAHSGTVAQNQCVRRIRHPEKHMPISTDQQAEIDALRSNPKPTLRAVSEGMESHLYKAYPVLDHGFVRVIDYMGDDAAICQAARVSYGKGTKSVQNDTGL